MTIEIPEDTKKSRLAKPAAPKPDAPDDYATAADRIEAFHRKYPDGSITTKITSRTVDDVVIFTARANVRKDSRQSYRPNATAHATRSTADSSEIAAERPQETAETVAISRALRNLGILTGAAPAAAPEPVERLHRTESAHPLAAARAAVKMSQRKLAAAMTEHGAEWSQSLVSKVESGQRDITHAEAVALDDILGTNLAEGLIIEGRP